LQQNSALQGVEIKTLAKQMGETMEAAYAMFAYTLEQPTDHRVKALVESPS
jgi:hypothetical protein